MNTIHLLMQFECKNVTKRGLFAALSPNDQTEGQEMYFSSQLTGEKMHMI